MVGPVQKAHVLTPEHGGKGLGDTALRQPQPCGITGREPGGCAGVTAAGVTVPPTALEWRPFSSSWAASVRVAAAAR